MMGDIYLYHALLHGVIFETDNVKKLRARVKMPDDHLTRG